ncbi:hypothetical protein Hypma_010412 [Hypsizygus marmoreus]|uniref:Uncharacterized protein n=1 Tax=Hypsizygus marmoreus TaxID=39966 RepID=A0A369JM62_HYPMA|nr:hypothetical protein Hypma_010408 [Hypsizygus marmoreus]RDB22446.1 hypothetical protein Hypma_010412 [Hypsizygus marmoreus]
MISPQDILLQYVAIVYLDNAYTFTYINTIWGSVLRSCSTSRLPPSSPTSLPRRHQMHRCHCQSRRMCAQRFEISIKVIGVPVPGLGCQFLDGALREKVLDNARYLICEAYRRIHHALLIRLVLRRFNLSRNESEKRILNLVRETCICGSSRAFGEGHNKDSSRPSSAGGDSCGQRVTC